MACPACPPLGRLQLELAVYLSVCLSVLCTVVLLLRRLKSRSAARGGPEIVIERAHWVDASSEARTLSASKRDPATCDLDGGGVRSTEEQSEEELTLLKKTENRKQKQAKYLSALLELGCSEQF